MIKLIAETPSIEEYQFLRERSGLSSKSDTAARIGLYNALFSVVVRDEDMAIGMGRIIGDGGCFCQVVDICILPDYQGKGLGKALMRTIKTYIIEQLPESCYVSIIADGAASNLYEQFGFRDTLPKAKGMFIKK